LQTFGFPPGYFIIRSVATQRLWDVEADEVEDGTEIALWPEKDNSLVEGLRNPEGNNQVFFVDTSGALCSRSSGHAVDVEGDRLVLRHRRPVSLPFPNAYSHPLPTFSYDKRTRQITVTFASDPTYLSVSANALETSDMWRNMTHVISSIPMRKPRTFVDDASEYLSASVSNAFSFLSGGPASPKARPDEVFNGDIDLNDDEVLEQEKGEEAEVDDSPDLIRRLHMLSMRQADLDASVSNAQTRRQFEILPLRRSIAMRSSSLA